MVAPMVAASLLKGGTKLLKMAKPLLKKGFESAKPLLKKGFESAKPLAKRGFASSKKAYAEYSPAIKKNISTGYSKASEYIKNQRLQNKHNRLGKLQNITTTPTQASNFESSNSSTKLADNNTINVAQNNNTQQNLLNALQQSTALLQQTISQIASMGPNPTSNSPAAVASPASIDTGAPQPPTQYSTSSNNTNNSINNQQKSKKSLPQRLGSLSGKASVKLSEMKTDFKESYKQKKINGGAEGTTTPSTRPITFTESKAQMDKAFKDLVRTGKQVFHTLNTLKAAGHKPSMPAKQSSLPPAA
jgi:hypothetical protein